MKSKAQKLEFGIENIYRKCFCLNSKCSCDDCSATMSPGTTRYEGQHGGAVVTLLSHSKKVLGSTPEKMHFI